MDKSCQIVAFQAELAGHAGHRWGIIDGYMTTRHLKLNSLKLTRIWFKLDLMVG